MVFRYRMMYSTTTLSISTYICVYRKTNTGSFFLTASETDLAQQAQWNRSLSRRALRRSHPIPNRWTHHHGQPRTSLQVNSRALRISVYPLGEVYQQRTKSLSGRID